MKKYVPTPDDIRSAREFAGLSQAAAAALIYCARGTWAQWESGIRAMHPAMWELFLIKTNQHERFNLPG